MTRLHHSTTPTEADTLLATGAPGRGGTQWLLQFWSNSPFVSRCIISDTPSSYSAQRAPFEHGETIAYGLVKRWIVVEQQRVGAPGGAAAAAGDSEKLSAIIAHVRIFESTLEPDTGCPIIQQRSRPGYDDHYMLASHIVCCISVTPMPDDTSQYKSGVMICSCSS